MDKSCTHKESILSIFPELKKLGKKCDKVVGSSKQKFDNIHLVLVYQNEFFHEKSYSENHVKVSYALLLSRTYTCKNK